MLFAFDLEKHHFKPVIPTFVVLMTMGHLDLF